MRGVKHESVAHFHLESLPPMFEPANTQGKRQQVLGNWVDFDEGRGLDGPLMSPPPPPATAPTMVRSRGPPVARKRLRSARTSVKHEALKRKVHR